MVSYAQNENGMVIPYEIVGGKMCVNMKVDNVEHRFIFDTGGQTMVVNKLKEELGMHFVDSMTVTDATSIKRTYPRYAIDKATFNGGRYILRNIPALIMEEENKVLDCFNVVGIIGNDIISKFILQIDPEKKEITLLPPSSKVNTSLRNMVKFEPNKSNMPMFLIGLESGETMKALFDTGSKYFLSILPAALDKLQGTPAVEVTHEGQGRTSMGITGTLNLQDKQLASLPLVTVGTGKFGNVLASTSQVPVSLLGVELLQYGKVTIDYGHSRFYFEPFEKKIITPAGESLWNVGLIVADGVLRIASLWDDMKQQVEIGDEVLKVDGQDVPPVDFCESVINGLKFLKDKDKVELTVKNKGQVKVITASKMK